MSTTLANAVNGAGEPRRNEHPTIVRIQAQAAKFAEAMPQVMTPERFMRIAIGALRKNPKLLECDPLSLMGSLLVAAQLGFEVNTPQQHFYLIPRFNKKTGRLEADGQIGYRGWMDLLQRTGQVQSMTAEVVYEKDTFVYTLGDDPKIEHKPSLGERGRPIAYYVSVKLLNGGIYRKVLSKSDVDKYRARSQSPNHGPWVSDYDAMALKTTFLRLVTWLPKSLEIRSAENFEKTIEANGTVRYLEKQGQIDYVIPEPAALPEPDPEPQYADEPTTDADYTDAEVVETRAQPEPKPAPKTPRKRQSAAKMEVISEKVGPSIEAPFDDAPAHDPRTRPRTEPTVAQTQPQQQQPSSPLALTVVAIETWLANAVAANDEAGLPDLANRDTLMDWLWAKFVAAGQVRAETKHLYSRLNELAKLGGDPAGTIGLLDSAMESVRQDYFGVTEPEQGEDIDDQVEENPEPAPAAEAKPQAKPAENPAARMARIEKEFEDFAAYFGRQGVQAMVMPSAVVAEVYSRAAKAGLVKGDSTGYRTRLLDFAEMPGTAHDVVQRLKVFCKEILAEMKPNNGREPGADG